MNVNERQLLVLLVGLASGFFISRNSGTLSEFTNAYTFDYSAVVSNYSLPSFSFDGDPSEPQQQTKIESDHNKSNNNRNATQSQAPVGTTNQDDAEEAATEAPANKAPVVPNPDAFAPLPPGQRPWMVIHVGPPKTGTTTIQQGMCQYVSNLASRDNILYLGSPNIRRDVDACFVNHNKTKECLTILTGKHFALTPNSLAKHEFVAELRKHRRLDRNVVLSSEHWSSKNNQLGIFWKHLFDRVFLRKGGPASMELPELPVWEEAEEMFVQFQKDWNGPNKAGKASKNRKIQNPTNDGGDKGATRARRLRRTTRKRYVLSPTNTTDGRRRILAPDTRRTQQRRKLRRVEQELFLPQDPSDVSADFAFDVKVVVAYRHYFQWLPSFYYQAEMVNGRGKGGITRVEYIERAMDTLGAAYSIDHDRLDGTKKNWVDEFPEDIATYHGSLFAYLKWSSQPSLRHRVEIFDMHQQRVVVASSSANETTASDLFADFVCQALPGATSTCRTVRAADDAEKVEVRVRRKGTIESAVVTGILSDTDYKKLVGGFKVRYGKPQDNRDVGKFLRQNFAKFAKRVRKNKVDQNHELLCLSQASGDRFKIVSWNMLRHLEALVRHHRLEGAASDITEGLLGVSTPDGQAPLLLAPTQRNLAERQQNAGDFWIPLRAAHDEAFDRAFERGDFCELDVDRLYADPEFVRIVFPAFADVVPMIPPTATTTNQDDEGDSEDPEDEDPEDGGEDENANAP